MCSMVYPFAGPTAPVGHARAYEASTIITRTPGRERHNDAPEERKLRHLYSRSGLSVHRYYSNTMSTEIEDDSPVIAPRKNGTLGKLFGSCAGDPRGSVHRAWGISLLFVVVYFVLAIVESECY